MKSRRLLLKAVSVGTALALTVGMFPAISLRAEESVAEDAGEVSREVIEIHNTEDFLEFAENCYIDSWSADKKVLLCADIDLLHTDFQAVPVFTGVFDGQGHTISGFRCGGDGYVAGLFRYIGEDGVVRNLTLAGEVFAANEKECTGGLCGINYGMIQNCNFQGTVSGRNIVGGLAGINEGTGRIWKSTARGRVTGYYSTGGVAGINHGEITSCTNRMCVNNDTEWVEGDDEMGRGLFLSLNISDSETELFSGVDTGGIAGQSDGIVTGCSNYGRIGYEHTGYNIGGIAGRQSGVVSSCKNYGEVYGRKDVGGIVGQMEPYIEVQEADSLVREVNKLHDLIEKTLADMQDGKNAVNGDLDRLVSYGAGAVDAGDILAGQMSDFADGNVDQAQAVADRTKQVMGMLPAVFDDIYVAEIYFSGVERQLQAIADSLARTEGLEDGAKDGIKDALDRQQQAMDRMNAIIGEIQASPDMGQEQIKSLLDQLLDELEEMSKASSDILSGLEASSEALGRQVLDQIRSMGKGMENVLEDLRNASESIRSATRGLRSIVDYINVQPDIRFSKMGEEFRLSREELYRQLKGITSSLDSLNGNASDYSDIINRDLRAINDQVNVVFNLLADNITGDEGLGRGGLYEDADFEEIDNIIIGKLNNCVNNGIVEGDINVGGIAGAMAFDEEDPEDSAAGKVDYRLGRSYITQCIIRECVNEGYVTAKKSGAGGIVGYMEHGIVVDSEAYGSVESLEGDYVGGICGESLTVIRRCYALCSVSGGKNVGGIAGYGVTVKDCYAMVDCSASIGRKGAIAGQIADYEDTIGEGKISGNYYVGEGVCGIDNISYAGAAEPIGYSELLAVENLPAQFRHLKVIFKVDDMYLGVQEVGYGENLSCLEYPAIPPREGYYGVWPDCSDKVMAGNLVVKGEYKEDVAVVKSNTIGGQEEEGGIPYALVERRFTEDTLLHVSVSDIQPPEQIGDGEYAVYDIALEHAQVEEGESFAIRLYNPYEDASVWEYTDDGWKRLESKARGRYLQVDMTGTSRSFCVAENISRAWVAPVCAGGGIVLVVLGAGLAKKVKRGKAQKTKKTQNAE